MYPNNNNFYNQTSSNQGYQYNSNNNQPSSSVGDGYPNISPPTAGSGYQTQPPPFVGSDHQTQPPPFVGSVYQTQSPPYVGSGYPNQPAHTAGSDYQTQSPPYVCSGYPNQPAPYVGSGCSNQPAPPAGISYQTQPPPGVGSGHPNQPAPGVGSGYPNQPAPGVGSGYPNQPAPGVGSGYPNQPAPGVGSGYPNQPAPGVGSGYPNQPAPGVGDGYQTQPPSYGSNYCNQKATNSYGQYKQNSSCNVQVYHMSDKPLNRFRRSNDVAVDAKAINKAFKGIGCNQAEIFQVLTNRPWSDRIRIREAYDKAYNKVLLKRIKSEMFNLSVKLAKSLVLMPDEFNAYWLNVSIKGLGTDELCLSEVVVSKNNDEMMKMRNAYKKEYGKDMVASIENDISGKYKDFIIPLCILERKENQPANLEEARVTALKLFANSKGLMHNGSSLFIQIFTTYSFQQLKLIIEQFPIVCETSSMYNHISKAFMDSDFKDALLMMCDFVLNKHEFYAKRLKHGINISDLKTLFRIIIGRSEIDLVSIMETYSRMYRVPLKKDIETLSYLDPILIPHLLNFIGP